MSGMKYFAALAVLSLSIIAPCAQAATVSLSHYEPLQRLDLRGSGTNVNQKTAGAGPVDLSFDALGRSFELQLVPNGNLLDAARSLAGGAIVPYRGQLAGNEDSWVRIVIADGVPSGLVWDGSELLAIERPGDNLAGAATAIIYRLADALVAPGAMTCGAGGKPVSGAAVYEALTAELGATAAEAGVAESQIDIGAVGDAEFAGIHGANAQQAILERLNNVDGIFSSQVGVQINPKLVQVYTNPAVDQYPFSTTDIAKTLLEELAAYRNGEPNQYVNGLTHLFTGKDVKGSEDNSSTVGIAYTGALCSRQFGAGLSEGRNQSFDSLIAAHEIGHNFGAPHDGESPCADVTGAFIMATSLNHSEQFSQCSLDQMADDIARAACITPMPSVDMSFALTDPAPSVLLGNSATVSFDVINAGTLPATNVAADFTLPSNISLISAAASQGSCTDGGGVVNCSLGDVDGSTAVQVTITSETTALGSGFFAANVTADADDDPSNNQSGVTLTVQPAVSLSIMPPSPQQVGVDQSTGLTALVENASVLDATGVTLGIAVSSGLSVDSASWPLGDCSVSAGRVDCEGAIFAAQSNVTVSIGVTGTTAGANTVDFALSSTEADTDPADNSATATVNVGTLTEAESSNGGGGAGLWLLPLLGLIALRRRKLA
jgi:uncharacterized repeat protein (TIGR01451 family)